MKKILLTSMLLIATGCNSGLVQNGNTTSDQTGSGKTTAQNVFTPPTSTNTNSSGITGKIVLGPTCPVEPYPPQARCAPKPYQGTVIIKTADGARELSRFTSDSKGAFTVNLISGTYLLSPTNKNIYPIGKPLTVTVLANQYTAVTINYDSGIR